MRVEVYRWVASRIEIVLFIDNTDAGLGIEQLHRNQPFAIRLALFDPLVIAMFELFTVRRFTTSW
jgi:hypothetical protein